MFFHSDLMNSCTTCYTGDTFLYIYINILQSCKSFEYYLYHKRICTVHVYWILEAMHYL